MIHQEADNIKCTYIYLHIYINEILSNIQTHKQS